jgi:hypothetical protein
VSTDVPTVPGHPADRASQRLPGGLLQALRQRQVGLLQVRVLTTRSDPTREPVLIRACGTLTVSVANS